MRKDIFLDDYRNRAEMTQQQVADALSVSKTTVSNWEKGHTFPTTRDLSKLAALYRIRPAAFFIAPFHAPRKPEVKSMLEDDSVVVGAAVANVEPLAWIAIGGDMNRLIEGEQLSRLLRLYKGIPEESREQWLSVNEGIVKLMTPQDGDKSDA